MANDFLFELGCEELPSASVLSLAKNLAESVEQSLKKAQLSYTRVKFFATPRRLALLIEGLSEQQPVQEIEKRGPASTAAFNLDGSPTPALLGFAKSCSVNIEQLQRSKTEKGEWMVYRSSLPGSLTKELLSPMITEALRTLPLAKAMRWGEGDDEFARPVHWMVMLWGNEVLAAHIFGINSGRLSYGHRFHHPHAVEISHPKDYEELLRQAFVITDYDKRHQVIKEQIAAVALKHHALAIMPKSLLDEVCSIVEWPVALVVPFAREFLEVPQEALVAAMQVHQKSFALLDKHNNQLMPFFITIANIESTSPEQVIHGNEKVMNARLSDAAFFYTTDKKQPLAHYFAATQKVIFQAKLGTLADKTKRMLLLMRSVQKILNVPEIQSERAVELSKCDLMTGMVGEFPELEGLMGYYYAQNDAESPEVALALKEQYYPRFAADSLPQSSLGLALSLVDRLDTLAGIFAIGQRPSGIKDPFKLRRHALAIVRMLISCPAQLNLRELISAAVANFREMVSAPEALQEEIHSFVFERLTSFYHAQGYSIDRINAVKTRQDNWLYDFDQRLQALQQFIAQPEAESLVAACKRVNNLLQNQSLCSDGTVAENLLQHEKELILYKALTNKEETLAALYGQGHYNDILQQLAALRTPVDSFFDQVMVLVDDSTLRNNRLYLLAKLQKILGGVADISLVHYAA